MADTKAALHKLTRDIPTRASVDVLVAGGGLGGVSAAVAAARAGARTMLIERNGFPGGVATAGMCSSVFNCFYTPSHELVVRGNSLEFVDRLAQGGPGPAWHDHKGHVIFDVERGKLVLTDLLEEAGVECLFETHAADALMDGGVLKGVVTHSRSGLESIEAKVVVDATGDADVAAMAGAPLRGISETGWSRHSFCFRVGGVDVDRFVQYFVDNPGEYPDYMDVDWTREEAIEQYRRTGTLLFPHGGGIQMDVIQRGVRSGEYPERVGVHDCVDALQMHAIRELGVVHMITGFCSLETPDPAGVTRAIIDGRRMAFQVADYFRAHVPGFERSYVSQTADDLGIRATRWIRGEVEFTAAMKKDGGRCEDAVGRGVAEDVLKKSKAKKAWSVQRMTEATYDIPYGCLVPLKIDGLLMGAGRSVSAENPFLLRVMAITMVVGQGAGVAAAAAVRQGVRPRDVDVRAVQDELRRQGVRLD